MKTHRISCKLFPTPLSLAAVLFLGSTAASEKPPAVFEGKDTLLRPEGYRQWVFVGSALGLEYSPNEEKQTSSNLEYKNVYIDPAAFKAFSETGRFPDGTMFVLETASAETKNEPGLQGSFQKEYLGISAAVKDTGRFPEGWAYFRFTDRSGTARTQATPAPKAACFDCHRQKGAIDNVFTQFYPVLRAASLGVAQPEAKRARP
ncbi:MAG: cytochrome P460 family protein [Verrucomicrobia bacterium]|nr:cytochrome P460 family protein [Verrucomicrobiota bacterium]